MSYTLIYLRVSNEGQSVGAQEDKIAHWLEVQDAMDIGEVRWIKEKFSGATMVRPGWQKAQEDIYKGKVKRIIVASLDRLARTTSGMTKLFDQLIEKNIEFISLRENFNLATPAGRFFANALTSMAEFERECLREGMAAVHKRGKSWGGSKQGHARKLTGDVIARITTLLEESELTKKDIARLCGVSRKSVYEVINRKRRAEAELEAAASLPQPRKD